MTEIVINESTSKYLNDIKLGLVTCRAIADKHGIRPESVATTLRRAVRLGLVTSSKKRLKTNNGIFFTFSIVKGAKYIVRNRARGPGNIPLNKYDEPLYSQLDDYLYAFPAPKRC